LNERRIHLHVENSADVNEVFDISASRVRDALARHPEMAARVGQARRHAGARLAAGKMSAVLDVFDPKPLPASSPLWHTPNLIITPHCSSDDRDQYTPRTLDLVFRNMKRFIEGRPLMNRVSRKYQY
jgi:phosphoglycerate dehydrogenase-like enzyme